MPVMLAASFWSSFWPGLIAGLVSGALTAAVAGFVFYRLQIGWGKREREATAQRDLSHLLGGLRLQWPRYLLAYPDYTKASTTLPRHFAEAARLLAGQPLHQWRELLPTQSTAIDACTDYLERYETFIRMADAFDRELEILIESPWPSNERVRVHAFLVADELEDPRLGDRDHWLLVRSGAPVDIETSMRTDANNVKIDARYEPAAALFVTAHAAVKEAASTLGRSLGIQR
jgi:hypothetical protein